MTDFSCAPKERIFRNVNVDDPRFLSMKRHFEELKGRKVEKQDQLAKTEETKDRLMGRLESAKKAQALVQLVVQEIQKELEYRIGNLVTLAEAAVFDDPYNFVIRFELRRGRTECDLLFEKRDQEMKPLASSGGGAIDVAALALTGSFLMLEGKEPILILDEPFHNINDPSRELHRKSAKMLKEISLSLGIQIIVVTGLYEIVDVADKIFRVAMGENGVSRVVEEEGYNKV